MSEETMDFSASAVLKLFCLAFYLFGYLRLALCKFQAAAFYIRISHFSFQAISRKCLKFTNRDLFCLFFCPIGYDRLC